jgi:hypothetical protein
VRSVYVRNTANMGIIYYIGCISHVTKAHHWRYATLLTSITKIDMIIRVSQLLILILCTLTGSAQSLDCKKFRKGTFYTKQIPDNGYTVRTKTIQTTYFKKINMEVAWKIKWTSNCTYELLFDHAVNSDGYFQEGDKIVTTITSIEGGCYSFISTYYSLKYPEGKTAPPADMCLKSN